MKRLLPILIATGFLLGSNAQAGIVLYCQDQLATGFFRDENTNSWKTRTFKLKRYKIKFNKNYSVLRGVTFLPAKCNAPYKNMPQLLFCVHKLPTHEVFVYDRNSQRYTYSKVKGGFSLNNSDSDTLHAGTCKKL